MSGSDSRQEAMACVGCGAPAQGPGWCAACLPIDGQPRPTVDSSEMFARWAAARQRVAESNALGAAFHEIESEKARRLAEHRAAQGALDRLVAELLAPGTVRNLDAADRLLAAHETQARTWPAYLDAVKRSDKAWMVARHAYREASEALLRAAGLADPPGRTA